MVPTAHGTDKLNCTPHTTLCSRVWWDLVCPCRAQLPEAGSCCPAGGVLVLLKVTLLPRVIPQPAVQRTMKRPSTQYPQTHADPRACRARGRCPRTPEDTLSTTLASYKSRRILEAFGIQERGLLVGYLGVIVLVPASLPERGVPPPARPLARDRMARGHNTRADGRVDDAG